MIYSNEGLVPVPITKLKAGIWSAFLDDIIGVESKWIWEWVEPEP